MRKLILSALCLSLFAPLAAGADKVTLEITVEAGKHDRVNVPVRAAFSVPAALSGAQGTLTDAASKSVPCQITNVSLDADSPKKPEVPERELHFILTNLKAGETAKYKLVVDAAAPTPKDGFSWHDTKGDFDELRLNNKPVLRYEYKAFDDSTDEKRFATFKVYHHLFDLDGKQVTKGESTGLYPHHRGIFYGFKATYEEADGKKVTADTWHCPAPSKDPKKPTLEAHLAHEKFLASEAGPVLGRHRVQIGWHGRNKEEFATEERELTVYNVPGGRLVEFTSRLTPLKGTVKLDGDPQHAGFHFRAVQDVAEKAAQDETYFVRPDGVGGKGKAATRNWATDAKRDEDKKHVNLPWDAMSFLIGKQRYTVAYLDKPTNPKEARFSEREYGRIGSYFVAEATDKKPLTVNYRLWLQQGEMKPADVAALDDAFVEPPKVSVK